jgi:hypothetical protein
METNMAEYVFDVAKRIQGRARDRQKTRDEQQAQSNQLIQEVQPTFRTFILHDLKRRERELRYLPGP